MNKLLGFTLMELLITIAVLCSLLFFGLPLWQSLQQRNEVEIIHAEIESALRFARNMALLRNLPLTLNALPETNNWSDGMILFVDNPTHQYSSKDEVIQQWSWHQHDMQVIWKGFRSNDYLIFSPTLRKSMLNGSFIIRNNEGIQKKMIVNRLGHIRDYVKKAKPFSNRKNSL